MNFDQDFIDPKVVEGFGREKSAVTRKVTSFFPLVTLCIPLGVSRVSPTEW